ncbi:Saccharopine dehydrogenase-domain-containing protein [Polychytrium aggregatum]|uniref:Saccharopine dehydrogenase-domain-containing protein n=1 Tax=Polychytrium aggregatum TaxID=110093 RepID=UPI0022FEFE1D|nr:Saccharopine dehydrogenase-domain-containing protein [Polychytrium aggregatum]KAI9193475.1 Saccharopine dehydrogenase-domain-containing protein [Polychytrium aggregatum]
MTLSRVIASPLRSARPVAAAAAFRTAHQAPNLARFAVLARWVRTLAIRREDKNRWERRVPLVPQDIARLVKEHNAKVIVQPSTRRVYTDDQFADAGAIISEDLSAADIVLGVKEVPLDQLLPGKDYMFFSHTFKGQKHNMPMLQDILDKKIRLIDYELLTDDHNRRLVFFGRFAGYAGMIDGLHALGQRLLGLGFATPFLNIGMSYVYRCLADARLEVTRSGQSIMDDGLPKQLGPLTFVFTGNGNVTKGALHVFKCLPHEWVSPDDLKDLVESGNYSRHKVYLTQVQAKDYLVRKDGQAFDNAHYKMHPEEYDSVFHEKIAPYTSMLINGIFWDLKYPRLMTIEQTEKLARENRLRMLAIADISCDINGSLEFMSHASTIDHPFFMYDPIEKKSHHEVEGDGMIIMSIDNLPTEMPLEASAYFSDSLLPFVKELILGNVDHAVLNRATIARDGSLFARHTQLQDQLEKYGRPSAGAGIRVEANHKVLVLGSGYVAAPLVEHLSGVQNTHVTIASNALDEAGRIAEKHKNVQTQSVDVKNQAQLQDLVSKHDIVVSLIPATMHIPVAESCIAQKKHMVTASYISPDMEKLHERAKAAGVSILNEIGLDPGIDHLTAMRTIHEVQAAGGRVSSFVSWCGGLPAPEASNNPLGYKFSWSPRGVLLAGLNSAKFKMNGKMHEIPGSHLLKSAMNVDMYRGFALEGVPNRDSLKYTSLYELGDLNKLDTMFRGTLRYKGYGELMSCFKDLGLFETAPSKLASQGTSWQELMNSLLGISKGADPVAAIKAKLAAGVNGDVAADSLKLQRILSAMNWLGIFDSANPIVSSESVLDAFCSLLQQKLVYLPGERDMVAMQHEFGIEWADGQKERKTATLIAYGEPQGYSAMAKTVGLPAAIATEAIMTGVITRKGVLAPVSKDIYEPILARLEARGIKFDEASTRLSK